MKNEKKLQIEYQIALEIVKSVIGKEIVEKQMRKVEKVGISPKAIRRNGCCKIRGNKCTIELSKKMFDLGEKERITTLIHEIIHTFKNCKGHNYNWKWYANKITENTEYTITRTRKLNDNNIKYNYEITCLGCKETWKQFRLTNKTKEHYKEFVKILQSNDIIKPKFTNIKFVVVKILRL